MWGATSRRNRRNRFHPPRFRGPVAARAYEALVIDDAALVPPDPPSEPAAINFAALIGDVTKNLAQLGMLVDFQCVFDGIANHRWGAAEGCLPGSQEAAQRLAIRVLGHGLEDGVGWIGEAEPKQRLATQVRPVLETSQRVAGRLRAAGYEPRPDDGE